jgi:hypothetical protein
MKNLQKDEMNEIHGGELVCSESGLVYLKDEAECCIKMFTTIKGAEEDFEQLIELANRAS